MPTPLRARFPRTAAALDATADGAARLEVIAELEAAWRERASTFALGHDGPGWGTMDFDVVLAGGGVSLLYAIGLARAGQRVAVCDRGRIARSHREWNVSRRELQTLVAGGLFTEGEVEALILLRYERGIVRWHRGGTWPVAGVLDCAVDAEGLLGRLRDLAAAAGVVLLDHHRVAAVEVGPGGVEVDLVTLSGTRRLSTRLLLDATGACTPLGRHDLICPTVGGLMSGLARGLAEDEVDERTGEILISIDDAEEGRQHIWEGFPAPPSARGGGRSTLYLFYYAEPDTVGEHPLLELYERFFRTRPRYKRGDAVVERPAWGLIPAWSRLRPLPTAPADRILLVGDAAARHSPLTFCGFGATLRSFLPVGRQIAERLAEDRLDRASLEATWSEPRCLRLAGALSLMMIPAGHRGVAGPPRGDVPTGAADAVNRLLDAAFGTLAAMGQDVYARMVRDEIEVGDFARFMLRTAKLHPTIYREVFTQLSSDEIAAWSAHFVHLAVTAPFRRPAAAASGRGTAATG